MADIHELYDRFATAINARDMQAIEQLLHPDFVADTPQSGERSRGFAQFNAQFEIYPGGSPTMPLVSDIQVIGDEQRYVLTPSFRVVPLSSGDQFVAVMKSRYPDGTNWHSVVIVELRDEKIFR